MGDRRMGDRRSPEKGVIKIDFKDAVIYLILAAIIVISVVLNIVLAIKNNNYKKKLETYETNKNSSTYYDLDEDLDEDIDDEEDTSYFEDEPDEVEEEDETN